MIRLFTTLEMSKLLMLSGLPASGKSTYAKELVLGGGNWVRVNRDLLRTMLHFDNWSGKNEDLTVRLEKDIAVVSLYNGRNVVVDDTNLSRKHKEMWRDVAEGCVDLQTKFEHKHFDTDWAICLQRDADREKKVGEHVILNMAMQYNLIPELKKIVVCDIDGTVADCTHRLHHVKKDPKDWKSFFAEMGADSPRYDVYEQVRDLAVDNHAQVIFVSARPEEYREVTEEWLRGCQMEHFHLIMRRSGDRRPDTEVKQEILNKQLKHYEILKVFDDRPSVIEMWRSNGLEVEDVGTGIDF